MALNHHIATITPTLQISYLDTHPPNTNVPSAARTLLLLHGFPQTSHQFRHVIPLLAAQGYRCIAPDLRGTGSSTAPTNDFLKTTLAQDLLALLDHLHLPSPIHIIGHDIGGMVAYALASRHPHRVRSVIWGECPLPGTETYRLDRTVPSRTTQQFHFVFHTVPDLAAMLVQGKEKGYVEHFLRKISFRRDVFPAEEDISFYADEYAKEGVMRAAMGWYAAFETDAEENLEWVRREGKCAVPTMVLSGERSWQREEAEGMVREVTEDGVVEVGVVEGVGHYLAEEGPEEFVEVVLEFLGRH
ncbi:hypothetical protein M409DRAFT_70884 [Zasmidium cellare ATCC 36951]|uniref:AB hydrolase-1 domain-containing protein n=1 Tax=Zasmidium cellare ATCC 36951 TaxID=1080233 RepID=A0A6A6C1N5_ZASCE|nr:uncharacterized protein M409DRAFT_70884 [Zasmidium cellare ATCC 36951]KAF2159709.1 hypothetical protein M409DRAFT_70884 [Zasmidium cellare ATCC 36951]